MAYTPIYNYGYEIIGVEYSIKRFTESNVKYPSPNATIQDNPGDFAGATYTDKMMAHISFEIPAYLGLVGEVCVPVSDISTKEVDADGVITSYTEETIPTLTSYEDIITSDIEDQIKQEIDKIIVEDKSRNLKREFAGAFDKIRFTKYLNPTMSELDSKYPGFGK